MGKTLICTTLGIGILFLGLFVIFSLESLEYNEVGLNYSSYFKTIENKTYTSGIHFLGLGHEFKKYDLNVNSVLFSSSDSSATMPNISCRTQDGLPIELDVSF